MPPGLVSRIISIQKQYSIGRTEKELNDGDTLMTDSSTTCLTLLHYLQQKKDITIITNSISIFSTFLNSPFHIISTGGILRSHAFALVGEPACDTLKKYYVDYAIISCKSLHLKNGIMESNEAESVVKRTMMGQAQKTILLADHTKFNKTAFIKTCDLTAIHCILTDEEPDKEWLEYLQEHQIDIIY
jgi:DeoR/GlpR family transcriptional regulator of sugar metabolism